MSLKRTIDNENGFTYTLEAILGIVLILGTILFITGNMPNSAQKTGEHSKVQLVNIGRDALDLVELAPITDIFGNYSKSQGVNRTYTLVADKTFVRPGENVNFTVYYLDTNTTVKETLILEQTILGMDQKINMTTIQGYRIWNFSSTGEYNIKAVDSIKNPDPTKWSNSVTVTVGYYFLETDANGIYDKGNKNVSGIVYDTSWSGIPNLTIQILDYKYNIFNNSAAITGYERIFEDFEDIDNWKSNGPLSLNQTYRTQGTSSISLNGTSDSWIKKTNATAYNFLEYDNISLDIFSNNNGEKIDVELSTNNTQNKLIFKNINVQNSDWNKINIQLRNPDTIIGNPIIKDIDTINISVSNITNNNYFFDNLTVSAGSFSFEWPNSSAGTYYLRAVDVSGNTSNNHKIIYSGSNPDDLGVICCDSVIYETESVNITLFPASPSKKFNQINNFNINQVFYNQYDKNSPYMRIYISEPINPPNDTIVIFTAYTAGDYYIFYGNTAQGPGDPAKAAKTNSILIRVLPLQSTCLFGECKPKCAGLDMTELNFYMERFVPPYINYNLYLINPDGSLCKDCPEFKEIINGYPTDEAATVNKLFHLRTVSTEYLRELRMVLWYK